MDDSTKKLDPKLRYDMDGAFDSDGGRLIDESLDLDVDNKQDSSKSKKNRKRVQK